jgi:hypothetical protein
MELVPSEASSSTFTPNLSLPIHRWIRYSAGFSAEWARNLIVREQANGRRKVLDPFVGSGTTLLEAELCGADSIGIEAHPFVAKIAEAKLCWRENPDHFHRHAMAVLDRALQMPQAERKDVPPLLSKCYPPDVLAKLDSLRIAVAEADAPAPYSRLIWLTLVAILRDCSPVGTAPWQYVLPRKVKVKPMDPFKAFMAMAAVIRDDMKWRHVQSHGSAAHVHTEDARQCSSVPNGWADLVITSPPYANNYDYADATRLEMTFFGEIRGWGCLQESVRDRLVRSCTQHVAAITKEYGRLLDDRVLGPIKEEISAVCQNLAVEKENHGGKKPYNAMVAAYFADMATVWYSLRRVSAKGALVCFVVGDSAPYGVHVPVEQWLGRLAVAAGFESFDFEKTRDRNVKWKNRKHRVPLHEGRLWVRG